MPSTYTLNNGIELIGTGEQSGTWGSTTNTNLELLDTALDGQVTVTLSSTGSSGAPNALPISDGSNSNGRNRLVIFNDGTDLGATAYVQLTPNDSEKIIYVRNSLSGSRSILLFQGTYNASNDYEVPAGTTAVVFFNGAGSGAVAANVFNNAHFDALNVVGSVTVGGGVTVTGTVDAGTVEFDNLSGTGAVSVTNILDEDDMASDSATALATQQSIKKYVDDKAAAQDTLAEVLANGNTTGGNDIVFSAGDNITNASGDLTIDVVGELIIDTDLQGEGNGILLKDGGIFYGNIFRTESDLVFMSVASDEDLIFKGNDGGSTITALTLDMSEAGRATFNDVVRIPTNLEHAGDADTFFGFPGANNFVITAGNVSRVYGSASETVINEDSADLDFRVESSNHDYALFVDGASGGVQMGDSDQLTVGTPGHGRLALVRTNGAPQLNLFRADGSISGGDALGNLTAFSNDTDGNSIEQLAQISFQADGTFSANDNPTKIVFSTTPDASETMREVARFDNAGNFRMAATSGTIYTETSGTSNLRIGQDAGDNISSGGNYNTLIGTDAGTAITTGDSNVALGYRALYSEDAHGDNTAIGVGALQTLNAGTNAANVSIGNNSGTALTDGLRNVVIGYNAASAATTPDDCVIIGWEAAHNATLTGHDSVLIGKRAGYNSSTGGASVFIG
ncbi:MAG: hypothetical protein OEY81_02320, partial [Candidatus Bathyarchaeota archaeon]|nr:hypothetical protein [Candidatus Bathyarchaeota archaeon]